MVDFLIALSELTLIISYLFRDILYLRIVTVLGLLGYVFAGLVAGIDVEGMKALIVFNALGAMINVVQIAIILRDRKKIFLPPKVRRIYEYGFEAIAPYQFYKKIYMLSSEKKFFKGDVLATQDQAINELIIILDGQVEIEREHLLVATLGEGFFIGEMSLLTNENASATVKVISEQLECIVWNKSELHKLEKHQSHLYNQLEQAIALHLIKKLKQA